MHFILRESVYVHTCICVLANVCMCYMYTVSKEDEIVENKSLKLVQSLCLTGLARLQYILFTQ